MIDFVRLREIVKEQLDQDRAVKTVEVSGPTLEAAVAEAAALLDIPIRRLEYEVAEKGFPGLMGAGKKDWKIRAYERVYIKKKKIREDLFARELVIDAPVVQDKNGEAFARLWPEGAFLKVTAPVGKGRRATEAHAIQALHDRGAANIDADLVAGLVREAAGEYVKVGDFERQPGNDSMVTVEIAEGEMKACIQILPPGPGGCDTHLETYLSLLKSNRVIFGIKEDFLRDLVDSPVYREKIEVAEGAKSVDGRDAYIQYNFETDQTKIRLREGNNGKVDFKELNIIQNVVQNQPLAKKIPFEDGTDGKTVTGRMIPAKSGKDTALPVGNNVHVGDDGVTIFASQNGQVVVAGGKINVEPVLTIPGDVNLKTGNGRRRGHHYPSGDQRQGGGEHPRRQVHLGPLYRERPCGSRQYDSRFRRHHQFPGGRR